jgi:hypothetical protein
MKDLRYFTVIDRAARNGQVVEADMNRQFPYDPNGWGWNDIAPFGQVWGDRYGYATREEARQVLAEWLAQFDDDDD